MKKQFSILKFLGVLMIAALMCTGLVGCIAGALFVGSAFAPRPDHMGDHFVAGINKEVWENRIEQNLFPDDSFFVSMMDESEYVTNLTVHSPQAGAAPTVTVDPVYPLNGGAGSNTNLRTDTVVDWNIHVFATNPYEVTDAEEVQLSYDKMDSILYEQDLVIQQTFAEWGLVQLAATGAATLPANLGGGTNNNLLRSSGVINNDTGTTVSAPAYTPGATGNRLVYGLYDIRAAKKFLDKQNVPKKDRFLLMSPDAADQLVGDMIATKYRDSVEACYDMVTGDLKPILGFKPYVRSQVMQYNNAATPVVKAYGSAGAATDNDAILFWQKAALKKAKGDIRVFSQADSPTQQADVFSASIRFGCTISRYSQLGMGCIVQKAAA